MDVPATRICQFGFDAGNPSNRLDGNALWNTANVNNTGCYAYYDSTSDRINSGLNKVLWGTSYAGQIPQLKSPCGVNGNCSYTLNYLAPTLKCSPIPPPEISPRFGSMGGYLPQNYTSGDDYIGLFFMAFGGTIVKRTFKDTNSSVYRNFNMTLLTGVSPVTYQSWDCGFFNTSMAFNFTYTGQSSSQVVLQNPPTYLNEIDFGASIFDYDTYLGPNSFTQNTPVTFTNDVLVFKYTWKTLVLPYAAGVSITLIIISFGIIALLSNGVVSDFRFSTILRTTRNDAPEFNRLFRGAQLGANPLPEVIEKTKLRFGSIISDGTGEVGTAFGLDGQMGSGIELRERKHGIRDLKG
ncbi:hypothetical protein D6C89_08595 [Aureobasidium pullulans]|nr:hypothetical protein D6C89_08595 [Aureobasidium pullulans]